MVTYNRQFGLQADALGFLISQNRLEKATRDMGQDVKRMVDVLEDMRNQREENPPPHHLSGLALAVAQAGQQQTIDIVQALRDVQDAIIQRPTIDVRTPDDLIVRPTSDQNSQPTPTPPLPRPTIDVRTPDDLVVPPAPPSNNQPTPPTPADDTISPDTVNTDTVTTDTIVTDTPPDATPNTDPPAPDTPTPDATPATPPVPPTRERGPDGRFGSGSKNQSWFDRFKNAVSGGVKDGMPDTRGVDPTVDAINELGTLFSPVTKMASFALKPIGALWRSRKKKEPLSDDENRHNRRQIKLLDAIAKALGRRNSAGNGGNGGNAGGGLFGWLGGLFGRGGLKGLLKKLPLIGGLLTLFDAGSDFFNAKTTEGKGQAVGQGVGAIIGGVLGTALGPVGTIIGSVVGAWVGEKLGGIVAPYFADLVEGMGKSWDESIAPFFTSLNEFVKEKTGIDIGGAAASAWDATKKFFGGDDAQDGAKTDYSKDSSNRQMQVFQAFRSAGFNQEQAKAMTAEVGREGDYNDKYLFGGHSDPKNKKSNQGMFSWQGDRRDKLVAHMKKLGLVNEDGTFKKTQESLNAQAAFAKKEIESGQYEKTRKLMASQPDASAENLAYTLGKDYIGWRIDDPKYSASGNKRRRDHLKNLERQIAEKGSASQQTPKPTPMPEEDDWSLSGILSSAKDYWFGSDKPMAPTPAFVEKVAPMAPVSAIPPAPDMKAPMRLPPPPAPKPAPERLGSQQNNQQPQVMAASDGISQNVSDRDIAHAVTGGIGARSWQG